MDQYKFPCGCEVIVDEKHDVATSRCAEHKKKFPSPLDDKPKKEK